MLLQMSNHGPHDQSHLLFETLAFHPNNKQTCTQVDICIITVFINTIYIFHHFSILRCYWSVRIITLFVVVFYVDDFRLFERKCIDYMNDVKS